MFTLGFIYVAMALIFVQLQGIPWLKAYQFDSLLLKFEVLSQIQYNNIKMKVQLGNFPVLERLYIKQFNFFPSNDNWYIKTLIFKIENPLFWHVSSILI